MTDNIYGLIGGKLGHSFSPEIHRMILKKLNLQGTYDLYEVNKDELELKINEFKKSHAKGMNVTIPYKTEVMKYLDCISEEAGEIGAVNTIDFKKGILTGLNTDYYGFGASLENYDIHIAHKNAVILGTGGASRAVVRYLLDNNINEVIFVSRNPEKVTIEDQGDIKVISYEDLERLKLKDIIINCTPCGMYPDSSKCPVNERALEKFSAAVDLIYNPETTMFLKQASNLGLKTVNGLFMLVAQAAASEEIWQGIKIDKASIKEIYEETKSLLNSKSEEN